MYPAVRQPRAPRRVARAPAKHVCDEGPGRGTPRPGVYMTSGLRSRHARAGDRRSYRATCSSCTSISRQRPLQCRCGIYLPRPSLLDGRAVGSTTAADGRSPGSVSDRRRTSRPRRPQPLGASAMMQCLPMLLRRAAHRDRLPRPPGGTARLSSHPAFADVQTTVERRSERCWRRLRDPTSHSFTPRARQADSRHVRISRAGPTLGARAGADTSYPRAVSRQTEGGRTCPARLTESLEYSAAWPTSPRDLIGELMCSRRAGARTIRCGCHLREEPSTEEGDPTDDEQFSPMAAWGVQRAGPRADPTPGATRVPR